MGDMGEMFKAMKQARKENRARRLSGANPEGWHQHTEYHWYRYVDGVKFDYWPSSGLVMSQGKRYNINSKFIQSTLENK